MTAPIRLQIPRIDPAPAAPYIGDMIAELDTLEAKIRSISERCHGLRTENLALRQQLLAAQQDNKQLAIRLETARVRLQGLIDKLPETS